MVLVESDLDSFGLAVQLRFIGYLLSAMRDVKISLVCILWIQLRVACSNLKNCFYVTQTIGFVMAIFYGFIGLFGQLKAKWVRVI